MSSGQIRSRRAPVGQTRRRVRAWVGRGVAATALLAVVFAAAVIAFGFPGGGSSRTGAVASHAKPSALAPRPSASPSTTGTTGAPVPVLTYHIVAPAPPGASNPSLYVPQDQFTAQMQALKNAGWHAVTLDQLEAHWTHGTSLGSGKPIVLTFDTGYHSQFANALPILRSMGWVGNENLVVNGLAPSDGGISDSEVRGLIAAGWEIDTQGLSHADLIAVGSGELQAEVATARQDLHQHYGVPVNWFCYPFGHYNAAVIAAVKSAGYTGATTVNPGLADHAGDPYRLPRLSVPGGTSPSALIALIASARAGTPPPASYSGPGLA